MSSLLKVRPEGWKCGKCRHYAEDSSLGYDGVCLLNAQHRSVVTYAKPKMRDDWCMQYEEKKQAKTGEQFGLGFGGDDSREDKTGGDR